MDLFEAIGIRKSLPTTNGWPLLLCLFQIGRVDILGEIPKKIDSKNAKEMFYENVPMPVFPKT